ncbi:MAG: response regulator [Bacteroidota bacterium]|nr:response regulator [Bacteroidota bacterium]
MKKILVVNNDFDTMTLLKNWLEKKAYEVKFTGNEAEVFTIINKFDPDLMLIDVSHSELISTLKKQQENRQAPILLMTGYTFREATRKLPVDDSIEKPFNLGLFEKKIETLLQRRIA